MSGAALVFVLCFVLGLVLVGAVAWALLGHVRSFLRVVRTSSDRLAAATESLGETESAPRRRTNEY